jgi:hypothetical protein
MDMFLRSACIAALCAAPCLAQTGAVTVSFYTPAHTLKSETAGFLPKSQQPFEGWLFDGPQLLAHVRPGRFMTFHLKPGAHSFGVPWNSVGPGKEPLAVNITEGSQYCFRLSAKMTNYQVFLWLNSTIEKVPCEQAQREAAHLKPIDIKRVDAAVRAELDPATSFPGSGQPQH